MVNSSNDGPRSFFDSDYFKNAPNYFIFTDPDIELPDHLPKDFLSRLIQIERENKIGKVGCALRLDDYCNFDNKTIIRDGKLLNVLDWEKQFWENEIEPTIYSAQIDTTFAVYNKENFKTHDFYRALRVAGSYSARHRPWYKDKRIPQQEWEYYLRQTRHSFWFNLNEVENNLEHDLM
ncbi:hypothetical protein [Methylobacterium sp. J-077]|uniref:hypothetical protein n=1 Tax=Methylobacterium sp. J-077 TaxID=2836656 RepID=UPI001FB88449|nr:hypothetical protein [Methylobacterium sp. J-077]MCJ2123704.1 hypothetical protein [Methylobacterium sp. J-077]